MSAVQHHGYGYVVAVSIDRLAAAVIFNRLDCTISTLCWIARNADSDPVASRARRGLNLYAWQLALLLFIGAQLERFWPGHCARARASDFATAMSTASLVMK